MFCPTCGTQIADGAAACPHCGRRFDGPDDGGAPEVEYRFSGPKGERRAPWDEGAAAPTALDGGLPPPAAGDARRRIALGAGVFALPIVLPLAARLVFFPSLRDVGFFSGTTSGGIWASVLPYALATLLTPDPLPAAAAYWLALTRFPAAPARRAWAQALGLTLALSLVVGLVVNLVGFAISIRILAPVGAPIPWNAILAYVLVSLSAPLPATVLWGALGVAAAWRFAPWRAIRATVGQPRGWRAWRRTLAALGASAALLALPTLLLITPQVFAARHPVIVQQVFTPLYALAQSLPLLGPLLLVLLGHLAGRTSLAGGALPPGDAAQAPRAQPARAILAALAVVALAYAQYVALTRVLPAMSGLSPLFDRGAHPLRSALFGAALPNAAAAAAGFALALARLPYLQRRRAWGEALGLVAGFAAVQVLGSSYALGALPSGVGGAAAFTSIALQILPPVANAVAWAAIGVALAHAFAHWPRRPFAREDAAARTRYALALAGAALVLAFAGVFVSPFAGSSFGAVGSGRLQAGPQEVDNIARFQFLSYGALVLGAALLAALGGWAGWRALRPAARPVTGPGPALSPAGPPAPRPRSATPS